MFDEDQATLFVEIEYFDGGFDAFAPEYDSSDSGASVREGAFTPLGRSVACGATGKWKTTTLKFSGGRFANRRNGGDFRLALTGGDQAIRRITAKRGKSVSGAGS